MLLAAFHFTAISGLLWVLHLEAHGRSLLLILHLSCHSLHLLRTGVLKCYELTWLKLLQHCRLLGPG